MAKNAAVRAAAGLAGQTYAEDVGHPLVDPDARQQCFPGGREGEALLQHPYICGGAADIHHDAICTTHTHLSCWALVCSNTCSVVHVASCDRKEERHEQGWLGGWCHQG